MRRERWPYLLTPAEEAVMVVAEATVGEVFMVAAAVFMVEAVVFMVEAVVFMVEAVVFMAAGPLRDRGVLLQR